MEKIKVIVNNFVNNSTNKIPRAIVKAIIHSDDMELLPFSLTGPENAKVIAVNPSIQLFTPDKRSLLLKNEIPDIIIDFPDASMIEENVKFYAANKIPFIIGATWVDLAFVKDQIFKTAINAVVAPIMAEEIVVLQSMLEATSEKFPSFFEEFTLEAQANNDGDRLTVVGFNQADIASLIWKKTKADYETLGTPVKHQKRTYMLRKPDNSVYSEFNHDVGDIQPHVDGALDAIRYLYMVGDCLGSFGTVHSMVDVLNGDLQKYQKIKNIKK